MEVNITHFFNTAAPMDYSASVAEIGNDAGPATWAAACDDSADNMLLDDDAKRDAFKNHIAGFGAWSEEEIAAWSEIELNALFMQMIAGDMREADIGPESTADDWIKYEERAHAGQCGGNIFRATDGEVYYSLEG
jgi:hypothetical protein